MIKVGPVNQRRGYQNLRKGRRSLSKHFYLISTQTHQRAPLFSQGPLVQILLDSLKWLDRQSLFFLDTVVIMPDHIHILGQLGDDSLQGVMQRFKSYTSKRIGQTLNKPGRVWQAGYHDHAVRRDEDLNQIRGYCLNNPVRANMVDDFHDYPFWHCRWDV